MTVLTRIIIVLLLSYVWLPETSAQQPLLSFDLKGKPKKYEDKKLRSEKTGDKKWTVLRRFTQNGVTKFNWNFNANARLEAVLERAKLSFKEDYTHLLPFYNFSLDQTSQDKELDSVIVKTNTGILIHDLRNTWIDNLYMLMGRAYFYKKDFDTAYLTFQYINYIFSPREKDGYDIPIGSNAVEGGNAFSISTKEKTDLPHKVWSSPPSRNESFIWQIRTYIARGDGLAEAAGLIETLKHDPNFPERLQTDLYEVQALYFYQQNLYDSAAFYLEKALPNAADRQEKARWEYLIGQLYERAGQSKLAAGFYDRAVSHTLDPILDVYGRLNNIRQNKGDEKVAQENIEALLKMARRDRYANYRDIIYYAAAQMELERNNIPGAKDLLLKATRYNNPMNGDNANKSRAFLVLAGLSFNEKNYKDASRFYDSVTVVDSSIISQDLYNSRKGALSRIVEQLNIIDRQDSLLRIAALPEAEREAFVRKLAKQLRKQQGLKEEEGAPGSNNSNRPNDNNAPADLFDNNTKGDWYFYNPSLKSKGFTEFKNKWGNRQNVDNWRRMSAVRSNINQAATSNPMMAGISASAANGEAAASEFTYEGLMKKLPLTEQQREQANDSVEKAQFQLGKAYINGLEDYDGAIPVLEGFLEHYAYSELRPEALFLLYQCYMKTGNTARANSVAQEMKQKHAGTPYENKLSHPNGSPEEIAAKEAATKQYEHIYNLFIEGSFDDALYQKKIADSLYGQKYWTPQLLYIQSVYFIRQRLDDSAKASLQHIIALEPNSPMAAKAKTMIDVLSRRAQIEDYLTKLQIERPKEDSIALVDDSPVQPAAKPVAPPVVAEEQARIIETTTNPTAVKKDTAQNRQQPITTDKLKSNPLVVNATPIPKQPVTDSAQQKPVQKPVDSVVKARPVVIAPGKPVFTYDPNATHYVALVMNKVDPVYITEARNAFNRYNKEKYYNKPLQIGNLQVADTTRLMTISQFENAAAAIDYMEKARKAATLDLIPWLPVAKYSFIIVTDTNLNLLQETKDMDTYKAFLQQVFPGKF